MSTEAKTIPPEVLQRVIWIQTLTLIWMSVEAFVSLGAAWAARSPALLGFGGDSSVELLSVLAGLALNAVWNVSWADPVAAIALLPLIAREGWEASKGKPCC